MPFKRQLRAAYCTAAFVLTVNGFGIWPERRSLHALVEGVRDAIPEIPDITPPIFRRQNSNANVDESALAAGADKATNTTNAIWIIEDEYSGQNFFEYVPFPLIIPHEMPMLL